MDNVSWSLCPRSLAWVKSEPVACLSIRLFTNFKVCGVWKISGYYRGENAIAAFHNECHSIRKREMDIQAIDFPPVLESIVLSQD